MNSGELHMKRTEITQTAPQKEKDAIHQIKEILKAFNNHLCVSLAVSGVVIVTVVILTTLACTWSNLLTNPTEQSKRKFDASLEIAKEGISAIGTGATITAGVVLYLNYRVARKKLEQETQKAEADKKLAESRLTMERFSKAVEMLGKSDSIHLRLGGIYALENIANDSNPDAPDEDYRQVLEVLTAFVRENSPWPPKEQGEEAITKTQATEQPIVTGEDKKAPPPLPTDIQAVLTVLNRREHRDKDWEKYPIDLRKADLRRAGLWGANLQGAYLWEANLQRAKLRGANLQKADLGGANLQETKLGEANLQKANLIAAKLQGAYLSDANLQEADLKEASCQGADLKKANLRGANLWDSALTDSELAEAKEKALANIKSARNWDDAHYDPEIRELLGLPPETAQCNG